MLYFIGFTVTTLWLPPLSDIFGRKKFFTAGMALGLAIHVVMLFTQSWTMMIVMCFCIGLLTPLRMQVGFNYMIEFIPKRSQIMAGTCYMISDALVFVITTIYFWKISNDWMPYFCIVIFVNLIVLIGCFFLPESPRMLLELGREDEAITILEQIASFNGRDLTLKNVDTSSMMINSMETSLNATVNRSQIVM